MKIYSYDIEADNLLENITKVWCICAIDHDTDEVLLWHDFPQLDGATGTDPQTEQHYIIPNRKGSLAEGAEWTSEVSNSGVAKLACHNSFGYDTFVLEKFFPKFKLNMDGWEDTFIRSKLQYYARPTPKGAKSAHGLQAYGIKAGILKPEITDFTIFNKLILHRVIEDVKIQKFTYEFLEKERKSLWYKFRIDLEPAIKNDAKYVRMVTQQELNGAKIDIPHVKDCIEFLDKECDKIAKEVEPTIPAQPAGATPKISMRECKRRLGYTKLPEERHYLANYKGEIVERVVKDYHTPNTKLTQVNETHTYQPIINKEAWKISFTKLKYAREWFAENFDKALDSVKYEKQTITCKHLVQTIADHFEVSVFDEVLMEQLSGPFTRVLWEPVRLTQNEKVKRYLLSVGWKPDEFNYKKDLYGNFLKDDRGALVPSSPKLTETSYESLPEGVGEGITTYLTYKHRRRYLKNEEKEGKGVLALIREDGRLGCGVNVSNTETLRSTHSKLVNLPAKGSIFGKEMRKMVICDEGRKLVSVDQNSCELQIVSYLANNFEYWDAVLRGQFSDQETGLYVGTSGHCINARLFGIIEQSWHEEALATQDEELIKKLEKLRGKSKGISFGVIYGCSDKKLSEILNITKKKASEYKKQFLATLGLDDTIKHLRKQMNRYKRGAGGYLELGMGYWVHCDSDHKLLNRAVQGTGAVVQKLAVIHAEQEIGKLRKSGNIDAFKILDMHDEMTYDSAEDCAVEVGEILTNSYDVAAEQLLEWHQKQSKHWKHMSFAMKLGGNYAIGDNYLDVH